MELLYVGNVTILQKEKTMFDFIIKFLKNLIKKKDVIKDGWPGLIKDPVDFNDVTMEKYLGTVSHEIKPTPESYSIPYVLTVKDQLNTPQCVGFSCATLKEFLERREGNFIEFDGAWIYLKAKEIDGIPDTQGTYFRAGLKVLKDFGAKPLNGTEAEAGKYRIGGYVSISLDFASLKRAIYEFGAILLGFMGSNEGWKTAFIRPVKAGENQWGHACVGISYNATIIDGQNSWGIEFGDQGLFHFLESYLPCSAWAVTVDMPNDLLPDPTQKPKHTFNQNLSVGMSGEEVKALQDCFVYDGCMTREEVDTGYGIFGPKTKEGAKIFQQRYNIPVTGFVGELTRTKLNERFS